MAAGEEIANEQIDLACRGTRARRRANNRTRDTQATEVKEAGHMERGMRVSGGAYVEPVVEPRPGVDRSMREMSCHGCGVIGVKVWACWQETPGGEFTEAGWCSISCGK
ncbi:MAG: hypothetical protein JO095_06560 [Alphaproteobacteria bacterium]|nr:hypothetical protein [Alphaproteobacteria bacterium]